MTHANWRSAVAAIDQQLETVTPSQRDLASQLGVKLDPQSPALVAAQQLSRALEDPLLLSPPLDPSPGQLEFLEDLVDALGPELDPEPDTRDLASAWIDVLVLRRSKAALERLKLQRGDVVSVGDASAPEIVSSVGDDGTVYFAGGGGQRSQPHRLVLLARCDELSENAEEHRDAARTRIAQRNAVTGTNSAARLAPLLPFRVAELASRPEATMLQDALDSAKDERPMQKLIGRNPSILAALVRSTSGTYVLPLPRLGSQYVPDFAICATDSAGLHWTFVELESPTAQLYMQNGEPAKGIRTAIRQIDDWRDWLENNLDYARRPKSEDGLGLVGIGSNPKALVLIGVAGARPHKFNSKRQRIQAEQRITIHSYSWLVSILRTWDRPIHSPLEHYELFADDL